MLCKKECKKVMAKQNNTNILDKDMNIVYITVILPVCNGASYCKRILDLDNDTLPTITLETNN